MRRPCPSLPAQAADALRALHAAATAPGGSQERRRVDGYMHLLALQGWTLRAIGEPIGITREWARQRIVRAEAGHARYDNLPDVPRVPRPMAARAYKGYALGESVSA